MDNYLATDISAERGRVKCPALVAYRIQGISPLPASARYLASAIPHASLQPFPGSSLLLVVSDAQEIVASFREFLIPAQAEAARPDAFGFQTVLYTDIEGHTAMVQRLGDERGRRVRREHERITRAAIESHHGTEVLATGEDKRWR